MNKISQKTFLFVLIVLIISILFVDIYNWNKTKNFLIEEIRLTMRKKVSLAKSFINLDVFQARNLKQLKNFADEIKERTDYRTTLIDKTGNVLADSEIPLDTLPKVENHLNRPEVQKALRTGSGLSMRHSSTIPRDLIYYCETIQKEGRIIGFIRFAMFSPDYNEKMSFLSGLIWRSNFIMVLLAIVAYFIYSKWLNVQFRKIQKPLTEQRDMQQFNSIPGQTHEEFDLLARDFNTIGEKLQRKNEKFESEKEYLYTIFNSLNEGVAAFEKDGYSVVYNSKFIEILNIKEKDLKGRPFYNWLHFPPLIQDIEHYLKNKQALKNRLKYYGNIFIEYQILPVQSSSEKNSNFVVTIQDVTHLQRLETIRKDFVANVSHEFKTPLTSIRGYAETLLSGMLDDPEITQKFLHRIERQTEHMENLVSDLLQLSRIERNEITEIEKIEPLPLLRDIAEEFVPVAQAKNVSLEWNIPSVEKEIYIYGNQNLLYTLISNLVTNGIQYNKSGGKIWLKVTQQNDVLRIEVKDNGIGISQSEIDRIFERFYRTEASRSLYAEGSGLGLSIVRHVVELLNGKLGVESEPEKGSQFWVEIPLA